MICDHYPFEINIHLLPVVFLRIFMLVNYRQHSFICTFESIADPPQVGLQLGRTLDPGKIEQGDDVYFDCKVDANPKPYKISWYRNVSKL